MPDFSVHVIDSLAEFRALAGEWDALWARSHSRQPTVLSAPLANWVESFASDRAFFTICVRYRDRLVGGLPFVRQTFRRALPVYCLPVNCWSKSGDLLCDPDLPVTDITDVCVRAMIDHQVAALVLEDVNVDAPQWRGFRESVKRQRGAIFEGRRNPVGFIDVLHDWDRYEASWSSNHRGAVKRSYRKLVQQGDLRAQCFQTADSEQIDALLQNAFEIENRSWKGAAGSSVLKTPSMLGFMKREAMAVANSGYLNIWFLYFNGEPIAFEYCHYAKGVVFSQKIGYEPEYAKYGPGRLLRYLQLQQYHEDADCRMFDMLGVLCNSKAKWATQTYDTAKLYVAVGQTWPATVFRGVLWGRRQLEAWRGRSAITPAHLGARRLLEANGVPASKTHDGAEPVSV